MAPIVRTSCIAALIAAATSVATPAFSQSRHAPAPSSAPAAASNSSAPVRIVVELYSGGHQSTSYALQNIIRAVQLANDPHSRFVVVLTGVGVMYFRQTEPSNFRALLRALLATGQVECHVDGQSLERGSIAPTELLPGLTVVPSALLDIANLQREGYAFVLQ